MATYKYVLSGSSHGLDYWTDKGKIALNSDTTQKDLAYLYELKHEGVIRVEAEAETKAKKK